MRIVFVGANPVAIRTAQLLIQRGAEVVFIEQDRDQIDAVADDLDCGFLHGDGSKPAILREANPEETDFLFCLTENDQLNIIASLVGRSLGFRRVVNSIQDPEFWSICRELGLEDTIDPTRTISRYLADMARGTDIIELSTAIRGEARVFSFVLRESTTLADLDLPSGAKAVCYYRQDAFHLVDEDTRLKADDEVIVLTHSRNLPELKERWQPEQANNAT